MNSHRSGEPLLIPPDPYAEHISPSLPSLTLSARYLLKNLKDPTTNVSAALCHAKNTKVRNKKLGKHYSV